MTRVLIGPTKVESFVVTDVVDGTDVPSTRVSATITVGDVDHDLWYIHDADIPPARTDLANIWFPLAMLAGMRTGWPVHSVEPASHTLLENLHEVQEIWKYWYGWHPVELSAPASVPPRRAPRRTEPRGTGAFFTGGVDSFHTLMRRQDKIDYLIYGYGLEFPLHSLQRTKRLRPLQERVAAATGKKMLAAQTNVRAFVKTYADWVQAYGAALDGMAHVFSSVVEKVYLPAAYTYSDAVASGSSPVLDHWWSSDAVRIRNDGAAWTRFEKIRELAPHDLVMQNLRVCGRYSGGINCGECTKCIGAMVALTIVGELHRAKTLPTVLDLDLLREIKPMRRASLINLERSWGLASAGGHDDLAKVLRELIDDSHARFDDLEEAAP